MKGMTATAALAAVNAREWLSNHHERGERTSFTFIAPDENGRGAWALDIIQIERDSYSVQFDNDMDVTYFVISQDEVEAMVNRIEEGANVEYNNLADRED